jgi:4-hydroxyphenylpyruvate dioxygenase-like putative hemolysin
MTVKSTLSNLAHIAVVVKDIDKAVKRLEGLGIGPFKPYDAGSLPPLIGKPLLRDKPSDGKVKGFASTIGEKSLEIIQPVKGESPHKEFLDRRGEGIHHIAFVSDDIDKDVAGFTEQGATVLLSGKWQVGGFAYLDLGVGNIIIELEQK